MLRLLGGLLAALATTSPLPVLAETPPADAVEADDLFYQGKSLMEEGHVSAACQKFEESLTVRRRGGALLNLAVCRAKQGRYATAMGLFQQALDLAKKGGNVERQQFALAEIEVTRLNLSWLTVAPPAHAKVTGLRIQRDGQELSPADWGIPQAVDPGRHIVSALAPGAKGFETAVLVGGPGDRKSMEIPDLAPESTLAVPPNAAAVSASAVSEMRVTASPAGAPSSAPAWRRLAWASTGLGVAALAAGLGFGAAALIDADRTQQLCPGGKCPTDEGLQKHQDASREATAATVLIPVGVAVAGVGVYMLIASARPAAHAGSAHTGLQIVPAAAAGMAALSLQGAW